VKRVGEIGIVIVIVTLTKKVIDTGKLAPAFRTMKRSWVQPDEFLEESYLILVLATIAVWRK